MYGFRWEMFNDIIQKVETAAPAVRNVYDILSGKRSAGEVVVSSARQAAGAAASKASSWLPWVMGGMLLLYISRRKRR